MEHRHLWLRSQRQRAIVRVRHTVIEAIRDYFDDNGFILVDTPIFTPAAVRGDHARCSRWTTSARARPT